MSMVLTKSVTRKPRPLSLLMPDLPTVPEAWRGKPYALCQTGWLLGAGESNPKLAKSELSGVYRAWGLTLSPAKTSGYQLCSSSSEGCRAVCLNVQGQGRVFPSIHAARIARSVAWMEHRDWFISRLRWELDRIVGRAVEAEWSPVVRLNVMSDVFWERELPWVFSDYPGIQFYDYTKHYRRMVKWCGGELPPNYHLTFSKSESNLTESLDILGRGGNVTVVFRTKKLPLGLCGFPVVNGDETDLRFLDRPASWVGLYAKGTASKDESGFVMDPAGRVALN
jgi:hypothetical protein